MAKDNIWAKLAEKELERALADAIYSEMLSIRWIKLSKEQIANVSNQTVKNFAKNVQVKLK